MLILAFESSCDETAVALVEDGRKIISNRVFSQADLHAVYGGVVPEIASRCHVEAISILTEKCLNDAGIDKKDIDAVAVTYAPGLIGALLVGVNFAKSFAWVLGVPIIPVHHIKGHIAANYLAFPELEPPFLCLSISGGNSLLVNVKSYTDMEILGSSRDDAEYVFPIGNIAGSPYDMSFSGLKTAVINLVHNAEQKGEEIDRASLAASFTKAVSDSLVPRTMLAAEELGYKKIAVAGGVAANKYIRQDFREQCDRRGIELFIPPMNLCGDNAAMIGAQAYYEYLAGNTADIDLNAYASLDLDSEGAFR